MGLAQLNFAGLNKVEVAIERLKYYEPPGGYFLAFSGGKDSVVIYDLAVKASVRFDSHYNITGIDPPELVYFIRQHYPEVIWEKPLMTLWKLIEHKSSMPTRVSRFCCEYLKEHSGVGRVVLTGIRWQESWRRRRRSMIENCPWHKGKAFLHPIIDWSEREVWEYIRQNDLPYCSLYDQGFRRLGCVLCPLTTRRQTERDMERWPKIAQAWYRACERVFAKGTEGTKRWKSAEEMWQWWLNRRKDRGEPQQALFGD